MSKYFNYLVKTFALKKYPYVFLVLGIVLYLALTVTEVVLFNKDNLSYLRNVSTFNYFLPFIFMVLYTCFFCLHFFREPQDDGTELLFSTSNIGRKKIISTKFLASLFYIFLFQIICFAFYWVPVLVDKQANFNEKITYVLSLLLGSFLVQIFFLAGVSFLCLVLSKSAVLISVIFVSTLLPVLSFFMATLGNGYPKNVEELNNPLFVTNTNVNSEEELQSAQQTNDVELHYYDPYLSNIEANFNKYKEEQWYDNFAFLDFWNQFNSLYSVFIEPYYYDNSVVQNWTQKQITPKSEYDYGNNSELNYTIQIGTNTYATLLTSNQELTTNVFSNEDYTFEKTVVKTAERLAQLLNKDLQRKTDFNEKTNIIQRLVITQYLLSDLLSPNYNNDDIDKTNFYNYVDETINNKMYKEIASLYKVEPISVLTYEYFIKTYSEDFNEEMLFTDDNKIEDLNKNSVAIIGNFGIFNGQNEVTNYYPEEYIPVSLIIVIWTLFAALLVGASFAIYLRKDFV